MISHNTVDQHKLFLLLLFTVIRDGIFSSHYAYLITNSLWMRIKTPINIHNYSLSDIIQNTLVQITMLGQQYASMHYKIITNGNNQFMNGNDQF